MGRIGARVRELRHLKGHLSQERLAFRTGSDPSFLGRVERGATGVTVETVAILCRALGVTLREFFQPFERPYGLRGPRRRRQSS